MKITPQQARAAFYQAAANIEARPELYKFMATSVGAPDCPACMWGHVGRALGFQESDHIGIVSMAVGPLIGSDGTAQCDLVLYEFGPPKYIDWNFRAADSAKHLRAFADHHWPKESTEPVRPDLKECGVSFGDLIESLNGEPA